ncbi:hypothetical protein Acr_10g0005500 [Actinidia rufa]|uniref:Integrase catalytic domain-containing protein n=1 Tax=Actinidia rufa TaxID=165716 RepID=A0A7J0F909_9ERIC|nr:hypothetical protein Acr_10g0005500 [Actinidia rufa]
MLSPNPGVEIHDSREDNQPLCRGEEWVNYPIAKSPVGESSNLIVGEPFPRNNSGGRTYCCQCAVIKGSRQAWCTPTEAKGQDNLAGVCFRFPHYKLTPTIGAVSVETRGEPPHVPRTPGDRGASYWPMLRGRRRPPRSKGRVGYPRRKRRPGCHDRTTASTADANGSDFGRQPAYGAGPDRQCTVFQDKMRRRRSLQMRTQRERRPIARSEPESHGDNRTEVSSKRKSSPHRSRRSEDLRDALNAKRSQMVDLRQKLNCRREANAVMSVMPMGSAAHPVALVRKGVNFGFQTPFSREIEGMDPPEKFVPTRFTLYDGKSDPRSHVSHARQMMALWNHMDALMCRIFPSTQFVINTKAPKAVSSLLNIEERQKRVDQEITVRDIGKRTMKSRNVSRKWPWQATSSDCPRGQIMGEPDAGPFNRPPGPHVPDPGGSGRNRGQQKARSRMQKRRQMRRMKTCPWTLSTMIGGPNDPSLESKIQNEIRMIKQMHEVLSVQSLSKKIKTAETERECVTFSRADLERVQHPHSDPLVVQLRIGGYDVKRILVDTGSSVELRIGGYDVKRILVDTGSSVEVMYYDLFKQLKIPQDQLKPARAPLVGFNAQAHWPLGTVSLKIRAGSQELMTEFVVVDIPSPYNAIMGRDWLHRMKGVASTLHQAIKFLTPRGEEAIYGDQVAANQCYLATVSTKMAMKEVQMIEEDIEMLEDVGRDPEAKFIEELVRYELDEPAHPISVYPEFPLKAILMKADLTGRLSKWSLELGQFDISFSPRATIKGQVLADFMAEFSPRPKIPGRIQSKSLQRGENSQNAPSELRTTKENTEVNPEPPREKGPAELKGLPEGAEVTLEPPQVELSLAWQMYVDGARNRQGAGAGVVLRSPEGAVFEQCLRFNFPTTNNEAEYEALIAGLRSASKLGVPELCVAKNLLSEFRAVEIEQVGREFNAHADALASLASTFEGDHGRTVAVDVISTDQLPDDRKETHKIKIKAARFWISPSGDLYKRSYQGPYLLCVHLSLVEDVLYEIHEGMCGLHSGGRSLAHRALSQGDLTPLTSPWPFAQWGMDIVGVLPKAPGNKRFLLAATDYFTKWVEAEPLAQIRETDVIRSLLEQLKIEFYNSTLSYPQRNGQAEATNKTIMNGIKKRLEKAKGRWVDELANVLWAYRTTPRKATNETPYSLAFGFEAVIPLEVGLPTIRTEAYNTSHNNEVLARDLDLAEERRENALIRMADYQKQLAKSFNQKVQRREFEVGSLVLRKVVGNTKDPTDNKLGPNWEGPYK